MPQATEVVIAIFFKSSCVDVDLGTTWGRICAEVTGDGRQMSLCASSGHAPPLSLCFINHHGDADNEDGHS